MTPKTTFCALLTLLLVVSCAPAPTAPTPLSPGEGQVVRLTPSPTLTLTFTHTPAPTQTSAPTPTATPIAMTVEVWKGMAQNEREAWFAANAGGLGLNLADTEVKVLGGKGLVKLTKDGEDVYYSVLEKKDVTETVWTLDRWKNEMFIGNYTGDDGGSRPTSRLFNEEMVDVVTSSEAVMALEEGTPLTILHLDGGVTVWADREVAAQMVEEGGAVLASKERLDVGRGVSLLLAAANEAYLAGNRQIYIEFGSFSGAKLPYGSINVERILLVPDETGKVVSPVLRKPKSYFFSIPGSKGSVFYPDDYESDPEHWMQLALDLGAKRLTIYTAP